MRVPRSNPIAVTLALVAAADEGVVDGFTRWLDNPTVAFVLLAVGIGALMVEASNPGTIGTGVGGVIAVLLGLWSLSMQPVSVVGLSLIVLAGVLYAIEVFTPSPGLAGAFGSVALLVGGVLLIDDSTGGVPLAVVLPTSLVLGAAVVIAGRIGLRTRQLPSTLTGEARFVGRDVTVTEAGGATGRAFIEGAWWQLRSTGPPLQAGARARVTAVDGLVLVVDPHPRPDEDHNPRRT